MRKIPNSSLDQYPVATAWKRKDDLIFQQVLHGHSRSKWINIRRLRHQTSYLTGRNGDWDPQKPDLQVILPLEFQTRVPTELRTVEPIVSGLGSNFQSMQHIGGPHMNNNVYSRCFQSQEVRSVVLCCIISNYYWFLSDSALIANNYLPCSKDIWICELLSSQKFCLSANKACLWISFGLDLSWIIPSAGIFIRALVLLIVSNTPQMNKCHLFRFLLQTKNVDWAFKISWHFVTLGFKLYWW